MTRLKAGDIVLLRFPFSDHASRKRRPVVVVNPATFSSRYGDIVVIPLTGSVQDDELRLSKATRINNLVNFQLWCRRPACVFRGRRDACTTKTRSTYLCAVPKWGEAGLRKPTWLKPMVATVNASLVEKLLGALYADDDQRVGDAVARLIDAKFVRA